MIVLALLLVACGNDEEDGDPTVAPLEPTLAAVPTELATATTSVSTPAPGLATPATPVIGATPVASPVTAATPIASPAGGIPVVIASPAADATPGAGAIAVPGGAGDASDAGMRVLRGTVSLPGTINEAFVIADDGCVGLGRYAGLQAGQQVIVRDGQGAIVAVTDLAATDSSVVCGWTFSADVPEAEYYAISIPVAGERVYAGDDVAASDGEVELVLP